LQANPFALLQRLKKLERCGLKTCSGEGCSSLLNNTVPLRQLAGHGVTRSFQWADSPSVSQRDTLGEGGVHCFAQCQTGSSPECLTSSTGSCDHEGRHKLPHPCGEDVAQQCTGEVCGWAGGYTPTGRALANRKKAMGDPRHCVTKR
jgi:hypothetical protein